MKIVVLNSPLFRELNPLYDEDSLPPLGLGYIATALKKRGHDVVLIDAVADRISLSRLEEKVKALAPDYLATNVFTTNFELVQELIENIGLVDLPHVIVGGLSTRAVYKQIFDWKYPGHIDVVFGDGEIVTPEIVGQSNNLQPSDGAKNRRYFEINTVSPHFVRDISSVELDRSFFSNEPVEHPRGFVEANIVTSRGCIYNCAFCAAARSLNRDIAIRERSSESIASELRRIVRNYHNVTSIRILDDLFLKGPKCIEKATSIFSSFELRYRAMAHVATFNNVPISALQRLKVSGCDELFIGVESGSPKILKSIHKTHDVKKIKFNLSNVLEAGIGIKAYFIYGFPGETRDDFEQTYLLAKELADSARKFNSDFRTSVFQFRAYHGTELHDLIYGHKAEPSQAPSRIVPNSELSELVGRLQFNFHSGNHSEEPTSVLQDYIYKTANLTTLKQWGLNVRGY